MQHPQALAIRPVQYPCPLHGSRTAPRCDWCAYARLGQTFVAARMLVARHLAALEDYASAVVDVRLLGVQGDELVVDAELAGPGGARAGTFLLARDGTVRMPAPCPLHGALAEPQCGWCDLAPHGVVGDAVKGYLARHARRADPDAAVGNPGVLGSIGEALVVAADVGTAAAGRGRRHFLVHAVGRVRELR